MASDGPRALRVMDADFRSFIAPGIVKHVYQAIRIFLALQCSLFIAVVIAFRDWLGGILVFSGIFLTPIAWLLACLVIRICLEFVIVSFAIHREVHTISGNTAPRKETPSHEAIGQMDQFRSVVRQRHVGDHRSDGMRE